MISGRLFAGIALLIFATQGANADIVKKTGSGICHPDASSYYDRIKSYESMPSIETCLNSGGRLPKGLQQSKHSESEADGEYDRSAFGHGWLDFDSDGQDGRAEALIDQSTVPVRFATEKQQRVTRGRWISPFSGKVIFDASTTDADHVVPLKFAWTYGASQWAEEKRKTFANDPRNIFIVEASLNRSKGARDITEWLPPSGACGYIFRFVRIVKIYQLDIPAQKQVEFRSLRDQCANS
jgi:hypothetical protein